MNDPNVDTSIDLHIHSTESDGTLSPREVVCLAAQMQLSAIALTDHDTVSGLPAARAAAREFSIELVPGLELSTEHRGREVHILGYYIDDTNPGFLEKLDCFCRDRDERNRKMAKKLQEAGLSISYEALTDTYPDSVITRAHFARYLTDTRQVKDRETVFGKYLGDGCRCYVPREKITPFEAIDVIRSSGGLAYFAHPLLCRMNRDYLDALVRTLAEHGLTGLEAIYSTYQPNQELAMKRLAQKYSLLISGGSDFHGSNKPHIRLGKGTGSLKVPYCCLQQMKERLKE